MIDNDKKAKRGDIKCSIVTVKINAEQLSKKFINGGKIKI